MEGEMRRPLAWMRFGLLLGALIVGVFVAACGSSTSTSSGGDPSSGNAQSLLSQTFSSGHTVKSGDLGFSLTLDPSGSSTFTTPISLSLSGPFQSRGTGKLPESDFTIGISALGKQGSLGVISTGTSGYVSLQGNDYQLPASDFQRLEQSFSGVGGSSGSGLSGLGINPEHWLKDPKIVGTTSLNGEPTTHINAGVNVTSLLADLNTFLGKTTKSAGAGSSIPSSIPAATQQKIAAAVKNATVDIWTGTNDKTLRKLSLALTVPVTGTTSTELGGLTSAGIGLTLQYSHLNQTQTISAPTHVLPYSEFQTKLRSVLSAVEGGLGGTGSTSSSGQTGSGATGGVDKYSQCIEQAGQDVAKMQKCSQYLNAG
jgi:hypothetical protein